MNDEPFESCEAELVSQAEKEYEDAIVDLAIRRKGQIDPIRNTQRVGGAGKNGDTFDIRAKDVRWLFPSQDAKDRSIEECEHLIDQLKQNAEDMKTTLVVLPTNEFSYLKPGAKMNWIGVFQGSVEQVIDDDNLIVKPFMDGQPDIWIEGVHTAGLIDNEIIGGPNAQAPGIPIWVNGTKRYDTAIGSTRTILKADVFELSTFLQK